MSRRSNASGKSPVFFQAPPAQGTLYDRYDVQTPRSWSWALPPRSPSTYGYVPPIPAHGGKSMTPRPAPPPPRSATATPAPRSQLASPQSIRVPSVAPRPNMQMMLRNRPQSAPIPQQQQQQQRQQQQHYKPRVATSASRRHPPRPETAAATTPSIAPPPADWHLADSDLSHRSFDAHDGTAYLANTYSAGLIPSLELSGIGISHTTTPSAAGSDALGTIVQTYPLQTPASDAQQLTPRIESTEQGLMTPAEMFLNNPLLLPPRGARQDLLRKTSHGAQSARGMQPSPRRPPASPREAEVVEYFYKESTQTPRHNIRWTPPNSQLTSRIRQSAPSLATLNPVARRALRHTIAHAYRPIVAEMQQIMYEAHASELATRERVIQEAKQMRTQTPDVDEYSRPTTPYTPYPSRPVTPHDGAPMMSTGNTVRARTIAPSQLSANSLELRVKMAHIHDADQRGVPAVKQHKDVWIDIRAASATPDLHDVHIDEDKGSSDDDEQQLSPSPPQQHAHLRQSLQQAGMRPRPKHRPQQQQHVPPRSVSQMQMRSESDDVQAEDVRISATPQPPSPDYDLTDSPPQLQQQQQQQHQQRTRTSSVHFAEAHNSVSTFSPSDAPESIQPVVVEQPSPTAAVATADVETDPQHLTVPSSDLNDTTTSDLELSADSIAVSPAAGYLPVAMPPLSLSGVTDTAAAFPVESPRPAGDTPRDEYGISDANILAANARSYAQAIVRMSPRDRSHVIVPRLPIDASFAMSHPARPSPRDTAVLLVAASTPRSEAGSTASQQRPESARENYRREQTGVMASLTIAGSGVPLLSRPASAAPVSPRRRSGVR